MKEATTTETAASLEKLKKAELVEAAERVVSETGWLPEVLRNRATPEIWQGDDDATDEADQKHPDYDEAEADAA